MFTQCLKEGMKLNDKVIAAMKAGRTEAYYLSAHPSAICLFHNNTGSYSSIARLQIMKNVEQVS